MKDVLPARLSTTVQLGRAAREGFSKDALRNARPRIWWTGVIGMAAFTIFLAFSQTVAEFDAGLTAAQLEELRIFSYQDVIGFVIAALVFAVAQLRSIFSDGFAMAAVIAGHIAVCIVISIFMPWAVHAGSGALPAITWVVPIMILVPLVITTPPAVTAVVSAVCMLTMPGGVVLLRALGMVDPGPFELGHLTFAGIVAAGMAYVGSRVIYAARRVADVGKYDLKKRLDEGGMGEVYLAEHGLLKRRAAVKLILPAKLASKDAREGLLERFVEEATVTAMLRSPHTVQLFDFGQTGELARWTRSLYIAMELLDGMNLEHFIYRFAPDGLEPRRVVHWLEQACHSLGEAHSRGVVHRDVKPKNMMICRLGRDVDFLKVLDFGITKSIAGVAEPTVEAAGEGDATTSLTHTGSRMGTPGYMSPEQIKAGAVGAASDIYALGCVAYFLLAGEKPFEGSVRELDEQHVHVAPPPLSRKAKQPIPPRLEAIVMQCLQKDPATRPTSADEVADALRGCLDGPAWTMEEARTWWEKEMPEEA